MNSKHCTSTEYVEKYASPEYVDRMEVTSGGQVSHQAEDNDDESSMSSGLLVCLSVFLSVLLLISF